MNLHRRFDITFHSFNLADTAERRFPRPAQQDGPFNSTNPQAAQRRERSDRCPLTRSASGTSVVPSPEPFGPAHPQRGPPSQHRTAEVVHSYSPGCIPFVKGPHGQKNVGKERANTMTITNTDLFCGAGGSTTGANDVPGVTTVIAANHWDLAIETHQTNHPQTDHAIADIHKEDPRFFPTTDIAWMSPECTKWSVARGERQADLEPGLFEDPLADEAAQRSRMLMFDVPRFAAVHKYKAIIVENVVDVSTLPKYRHAFDLWLNEMTKLGYNHRELYLNAMHAAAAGDPAPQSRDRLYVVFWLKGNKAPNLDKWTRPIAICPTHGQVQAVQSWKNPRNPARGRYRAQYVYRCPRTECRNTILEPAWLPASAALDMDDLGQRVGDRPTKTFHNKAGQFLGEGPLAPKTMDRIRAALLRHGTGALVPMEGRDGKQPQALTDPIRTLTTRAETALVLSMRGHNVAKKTTDPLDTFAAGGLHHGLLVPTGGSWSEDARPVTEPMRTRTTRESEGLLVPADHDTLAVSEEDIASCWFRMLHPHEIARGMAFPRHYVILGSKRNQVRQAGNAVCPNVARDLISAVAESLGQPVACNYDLAA